MKFPIKKSIKFIKNYVFKNPVFVCKYILAYFQKDYKTGAIFYSEQAFFDEIQKGKSIIRIGDGEIGLIHGRDIHYQKYARDLSQNLKDIIKQYDEKSTYVLSIPIFVNHKNEELNRTSEKLSCWLPLKIEFNAMFNKKVPYADAHFFYYKDKMLDFFERFLTDCHVLFVTNEKTINSIKKSIDTKLELKSFDFVTTPSEDSFFHVDDIKNAIDEKLIGHGKKHVKIVISTGPTSKYLAYIYSKSGYICYDFGFGIRYIYDDKDHAHMI